jgi:acyl-CoA hydrolase
MTEDTRAVTGMAERLGEEAEVALKGIFEMVAVDAHGRPAPIAHSYLHKELEIA